MPNVNKPTGLTEKQAAFVREYLIDKNATAAAIRAGYSERSAKQTAHTMLHDKPRIKAAVDKALKEQAKRTLITADQVLLDIDRIANKADRAGEYHAAIRGKELIGKHLRLFTDKVELTGANNGPIEFTEIRRTIVRPAPKP